MVAVVGRPAERKLAQIASTDNQSARLICNIHKDKSALSRVRVLGSYVVIVLILPDIFKVL